MEQSVVQQKVQKGIHFAVEVAKVAIIALAIVIPVRYFLFQPFYVKQVSMYPTLQQYDYLVVSTLSYRLHEPQRGDIIVFNTAEQNEALIKRIIGLPGETIEIDSRTVYVNGEPLEESVYLDAAVETYGNQTIRLKEEEYFVMGDNRTRSKDSRFFGPIQRDVIIGKAWMRLWPFTRLTRFPVLDYTNPNTNTEGTFSDT